MGTPTVHSLFGQPVSQFSHPAFATRALGKANSLNLRELAAVTDAYVDVAPDLAKKLMLLGRGFYAAVERGEFDQARLTRRKIERLIQSTSPRLWQQIIHKTLKTLRPHVDRFEDTGDLAAGVASVLSPSIKIPPGQGQAVVIVDGYSSGALLAPALKKHGYTVVHLFSTPEPLLAYQKGYYGDDYHHSYVGHGDFSRLATILRYQYPIAAVIAGSEPGVELADRLSDILETPGNRTTLSFARRNKYAMHEELRHAGLRAVQHEYSDQIEEILDWVRSHGRWPVVLKPLSSAGTEDVYICHTEAEVKAAFEKIIGKQNKMGQLNDAVLVQEYLEGVEYAINTVSSEEKHVVSDIWRYDRHIIGGAATVYDQDWLLPFDSDEAAPLISYGLDVLDALGIEYGPAHMEIKLTPTGPCLVEVGARMCGSMVPRLAHEAIGYSQVELSLLAYLDPEEFATVPQGYQLLHHAVYVDLSAQGRGRMSYQHIDALKKLPGVIRVNLHFEEGSALPKTVNSQTVIGQIELLHDDPEVLRETVATIRRWEAQGYFETED